ncbi:MAG TPA: TRAP transporter fused permease subunit [Candidatus Eisenbacteria bacterium]|nr:TRAP transporter fused permease subunit [Candidatus Eisenbacteria bacterium]
MDEIPLTEEIIGSRNLRGLARWIAEAMLVAIPLAGIIFILEIPHSLGWLIFPEQYLGLFLSLALCATFLVVPERASARRDRVPWYDIIAAAGGLAVGLYIFFKYPRFVNSLGEIHPDRVAMGVITVILLAEASRRLTGWSLVIIAAVFLLYAFFAQLFPGPFYGRGWSVQRVATYLYLDRNGIFGQSLEVASGIVLIFILFGQILYRVGGAAFLTDFSLALMGRFRGGPAKMAIVSSSLFGTISGSAVANVVVDGTMTIPMMKKSGYPPTVAAAVEATASTGGQIMPPVMGAAAFLIAEYLQIPYTEVALRALVPAVLFYVALFVQVDLLAGRQGLRGIPRDELPRLREVMSRSAGFLVPLTVLVTFLFFIPRRAETAGLLAIASSLVVGILTPTLKFGWRELLGTLRDAGRALLDIAAITGLAGVVIGVLSLTSLDFSLTFTLLNVAQSSIVLLLVLTAILNMVLGLSLPTTAVYILLAVLIGPALVQAGIVPIAAHLFIFYFGMLSTITPPVCLAAYTAASLAKADPMRTGWESMRLGAVAYIVPFIFALSPTLLLIGYWYEVAVSITTAVAGALLIAIGLVGYLFRPLGAFRRALFIVAAVSLLIPVVHTGDHATVTWLVNGSGLAMASLLLAHEWWARSSSRVSRPAVAKGRSG